MSNFKSKKETPKRDNDRIYPFNFPVKYTSGHSQKSKMHKVSSLPSVLNGIKNNIKMSITASITTLKLNIQSLPKQPVPNLNVTAERYLRSVKPLLTDQEYSYTESLVKNFISDNGLGPKLQSKLLERYNNTTNWMSDWWLQNAYLGYRYPVLVHSSPGTVSSPFQFKTKDEFLITAVRLIRAVFDYDAMVKSGKMKQESIRNEPLDMQPYGLILGTHRRPAPEYDHLLHTDTADHIIIICNNNLFKLSVINKNTILSESELIMCLEDIVQRSNEKGCPIGILTGNDRDSWFKDHQLLLGLGENKSILRDIENSLFVLCLDKDIPKTLIKNKNVASTRALQSMTGCSSSLNAANRWNDKTVQYIMSADGFIGMLYEHSPCEGGPVAVLHDHVLKYIEMKKNNPIDKTTNKIPLATKLEFKINAEIEKAIEKASHTVDKLSEDIDMECFIFSSFGSDVLKNLKLSPDSFIQMAMNVAYYKIHLKPAAHYESAALRRFQDARTECIRSTSIDSVAFAKQMVNNSCKEDKKNAMLKAIKTHKKIVSEAVIAEGVDRHLFGLKKIAQVEGFELPELYKDVGYTRSTNFTLTSSQVAYKSSSFMCYGPTVSDGYGCCYNPRPKDVLFACSSFMSCKSTNTKDFVNALQETLHEMHDLAAS